MSYVDSNLLAGETVQYRAHLHPIVYTKAIILGALAALFVLTAIIASLAIASDPTSRSAAGGGINPTIWIAAIFVLLAASAWLNAYINIRSSEFAITDRRVMIKVGWLSRKSLEIVLPKVEGIGVDQSIIARMFNYGTIDVRGTGGTHERFPNIAEPMEFRKQVQARLPEA